MKVTVEQIGRENEEELIVRCYDPGASWVHWLTDIIGSVLLSAGLYRLYRTCAAKTKS